MPKKKAFHAPPTTFRQQFEEYLAEKEGYSKLRSASLKNLKAKPRIYA